MTAILRVAGLVLYVLVVSAMLWALTFAVCDWFDRNSNN